MKNFFTAIVVIAAIAMFTSCEQDAPEINFSQTDTHTSDFSGIIAAINSQTATLQLINDAIEAQTLSFGQKMDILQAAVNNGIITRNEQLELLIAAIDNQTEVIDGQACNSCSGGIYRLASDPNAMYMQPAIWDAIKDKPEWVAAILSTLSEPVVTITQIIPDGHNPNHVISYDRTSDNTSILSSMPDNTTIQIGGVNQELVKVFMQLSPAIVTYNLSKSATVPCSLGFHEIYITDARGTEQRYNLNGAFGGVGPGNTVGEIGPVEVEIYFEDNGNVVTSATVTANMKAHI